MTKTLGFLVNPRRLRLSRVWFNCSVSLLMVFSSFFMIYKPTSDAVGAQAIYFLSLAVISQVTSYLLDSIFLTSNNTRFIFSHSLWCPSRRRPLSNLRLAHIAVKGTYMRTRCHIHLPQKKSTVMKKRARAGVRKFYEQHKITSTQKKIASSEPTNGALFSGSTFYKRRIQ